MLKTNFSEKCKVLGELWLYYREDASTNDGWSSFFEINDIALPLSYMIDSGLAIVAGDGRAEEYIDQTWTMFCDFIGIDPDGWYKTIEEAFSASPNPPING